MFHSVLSEYLNVIENDIIMYGEEGKQYAQHGDMQKAQLMLTKKKLAEKEVGTIMIQNSVNP